MQYHAILPLFVQSIIPGMNASPTKTLRKGILALFFLILASTVHGQKKVNVANTFLPNKTYAGSMNSETTITITYFDEKVTPPALAFIDTTNSRDEIVSQIYTGSIDNDGDVPLVITYSKLDLSSSAFDASNRLPLDAKMYGKWKKSYMSLDSISTDSLSELKKFKIRQAVQSIYDQTKQLDFEVAQGETTEITRTLQLPYENDVFQIAGVYSYRLLTIENGLATISIDITGNVDHLIENVQSMTVNGSGTIVYDIKNKNLKSSVIAMELIAKGSRNQVGMELVLNMDFQLISEIIP